LFFLWKHEINAIIGL